jgi:hypothetical protein
MKFKHARHGLCRVGDAVYAFGGYKFPKMSQTKGEVYSLERNTWSSLNPE